MEIEIRKMTKKDVEGVWNIEKECFSQPWTLEDFYGELENVYGLTLIAVRDDEVAGFLNARNVCGEIYINNIGVSQKFRRKGIGKKLLCELEKADCEFITLEVRKSNLAAIRLYEGCGYEKVGERKNFYEKPTENALLMTKFLRKEDLE